MEGKKRSMFGVAHRYRSVDRRPSVSGTRPEKRLLERSSVWSLGSAPSSGGRRPVMLLFCSSLDWNYTSGKRTIIIISKLLWLFDRQHKMAR
jgi:hypothetical protein